MGCCVCIKADIREPVKKEVGEARNKGVKGAQLGGLEDCVKERVKKQILAVRKDG